jgi:phosphopantothenoylcysteine decarboxylase/phosphopantothenate--cysteine ligase
LQDKFQGYPVRILITAGPTREYIDDVRFISNPSSGKMGYAVAAEGRRRGHGVHLVTGPVCLDPPTGVKVSHFESAEELYKSLPKADCLVMAAAVGDYRPVRRIRGKHKKGESFTLKLTANRDVLASVAGVKSGKIFVGFAVEVKDAVGNARKKVKAKGLDFVVLNSPASFGAERAEFTFVFSDGVVRPLGTMTKNAVAREILDAVERLRT